MYTCEVVLKTAHETGNWEKIGELSFPNGETEFPGGEINSPPPCLGKRVKMRENCFSKIPIWGICVKQVGEMKGK